MNDLHYRISNQEKILTRYLTQTLLTQKQLLYKQERQEIYVDDVDEISM